ncbi:MAG TPA: 50S ribosomal protein L11 methyltransferase [Candidatus Binataceae bacterium]|nr:50S ribosomal protein L11 methyltransferase [Candidatus Binataceae bacterium]
MTQAKSIARAYTKAAFRTPAAMADEAAGFLVANGALGCAVAEMARPNQRPRAIVTLEAFFTRLAARELTRLRIAMRQAGMLAAGERAIPPHTIIDPGWATMWQHRFRPFRIGRRFLIVPPWEHASEPRRTSIVIKPARAFGTGHHPSTAGALRAIEEITSACGAIRSALDVGTGSGLLAIALRMHGAARVVAIDIDADALENARDNADLNGVGGAIRFSAIPLRSVRGRFDLVIANILAGVLIEMAPELVRRLAPRGQLVLGGILASESCSVIGAYRKLVRPVSATRSRGWATLRFAR